MKATSKKFKTVDEYFSAFPAPTKNILQGLRKTIKEVAPQAEEVISYNMPAFKLNGVLVYYAAYEKHIGFYPTSSPIKVFKKELEGYKTSKGAIQFPIEKAIPKTLVKNIVKYRLKENLERAKTKAKK
jgi:uncharacterized protein YdhG (YjbR/CyaY superfamily)